MIDHADWPVSSTPVSSHMGGQVPMGSGSSSLRVNRTGQMYLGIDFQIAVVGGNLC